MLSGDEPPLPAVSKGVLPPFGTEVFRAGWILAQFRYTLVNFVSRLPDSLPGRSVDEHPPQTLSTAREEPGC